MSTATRGKKRDVFTYVRVTSSIYYGWNAKDLTALPGISASDLTALGHISGGQTGGSENLSVVIKISGAKAPLPARFTKKLSAEGAAQSSVSTFCGWDKYTTATTAGWRQSEGRKTCNLQAPGSKPSHSAVAELSDGTLYVFPMNKADFNSYGAALGLKTSATITTEAELARLVRGTTRPKPGRASLYIENIGTFSSFYSTIKMSDLGQAGYNILSSEQLQ